VSCGGGTLVVVGIVGTIVDLRDGKPGGKETSEVCLLVEAGTGCELEMIESDPDEIKLASKKELC